MNIEKLLSTFFQNNITAVFVKDKPAVLEKVLELVKLGDSVAFAGSETVKETDVRNYFLQRIDKFKIIDPYEEGISSEIAYERRREALLADVLLTGSNAVTLDGQIVNMDNQGNRVAGISFGPRKVIIIVGVNKIVKNLAEARKRISQIAAPLNNKRLKKGNPCESSGKCESCGLPTRICRIYNVIDSQTVKCRMHVIIVNEKLGF
jgi:transposase